jgi:hypothetical protein
MVDHLTTGKLSEAFAPGRFRMLLLSLVLFVVGSAVASGYGTSRFVEFVLIAFVLGVAVLELRAPGQRKIVPMALVVSMILVRVIERQEAPWRQPLIASTIVAIFAGIVIWLAYGSVMRAHRPVGDRIVGAICVYVLIGLGWGTVYETLDGVVPGSLRFPADTAWSTPTGLRYRYFSFVTLATLGYGDITPATTLAGMLAAVEAIAGQLYIGITVARLVALSLVDHAASGQRSESS